MRPWQFMPTLTILQVLATAFAQKAENAFSLLPKVKPNQIRMSHCHEQSFHSNLFANCFYCGVCGRHAASFLGLGLVSLAVTCVEHFVTCPCRFGLMIPAPPQMLLQLTTHFVSIRIRFPQEAGAGGPSRSIES